MTCTFSLTDQIIYTLQNGGEPWGAQFLWLLLIWTQSYLKNKQYNLHIASLVSGSKLPS